MYDFYPIAPDVTPSGAFAAFADWPNAATLKPLDLPPGTQLSAGSFDIVNTTMSAEMAVKLGFGPMFSGGAGRKTQAFFYEATVFNNVLQPASVPGAMIVGTRWGVGLRISVKVTSDEVDTDLSIGLIAAKVHLRRASASYRIEGLGLGAAALTAVADVLPTIGEFSLDAYKRIGDVTKILGTYLTTNIASLVPIPYQIAIARQLTRDQLVEARSVVYAMKCLARGLDVDRAEREGGLDVDLATVQEVYGHNATNPAAPTGSEQDAAKQWVKEVRGLTS